MKTLIEISDKINHHIELLDHWREELRRTQSYIIQEYIIQEIKGRIEELKWVIEE